MACVVNRDWNGFALEFGHFNDVLRIDSVCSLVGVCVQLVFLRREFWRYPE